jgi:hypothetical protein
MLVLGCGACGVEAVAVAWSFASFVFTGVR